MAYTYVAGDIGGTNARLRLFSVPETGDEEMLFQQDYKSADFSNLSDIVTVFFEDAKLENPPPVAAFSVAGPVKNGAVSITNLGWNITEEEMENELGIDKVTFLNDFAACGYGVNLLENDELYEISNNKLPVKDAPKVIIGAGTGLGEACIFNINGECLVVPGEGGHKDFCPRNKEEFELLQFIKTKLNLSRVGVERVVSGPGLENIYWYFVHKDPKNENIDVTSKVRSSVHPPRIISKLAIEKADTLCEKALKMFISCYGAEAGNMALSVLPAGGVYVAGGIAPKIRDVIDNDFLEAFYNKGRMRNILATFPIYIVTNLSIGILGARYIARKSISEKNQKIQRALSYTDIHSMDQQADLLSSQQIDFTVEEKHKPHYTGQRQFSQQRRSVSSASKPRIVKKEEKESALEHLLWMSAGVALSGLLLGAFFMGKKSK